MAGLATALRLRARGWDVVVCEAGPAFGGKMNRWCERGYTFDTGPSLITLPHVFADLYAAIGERMDEHLSLARIDPHAEFRFADGARLVAPDALPAWEDAIREVEPADVRGFRAFRDLGRRLYQLSCRTFFRRSPWEPPRLADLALLRHLPVRRAWGNYAAAVAHFFRSPYLRQVYNRYPTYVGSSPYACPATLLVIPYLEQEFGAWYVRGGLYRVVESLVALAAARGIDLRVGARVVAIERRGGRAVGVRLADGTAIAADAVVMNGDAATAPALLGERAAADPGSRSLSGFVLLLGVRRRPALPHHTVLFSADYRAEFAELFDRRAFPWDPTVYISSPAATDASVAPAGGDALFVMANAPGNDDSAWSAARIEQARGRVMGRLAAAGIEVEPEAGDVWHPGRFQARYLAPGGAIYGTHSHGWRRAFLRPPNRDRRVAGLYYAGGSTHPGGGTPTVLMSAAIVAEMIDGDR